MLSIYTSKLYRSSFRKAGIRAAIANPVNQELVRQLNSYIDFQDVDPTLYDDSDSKVAHTPSDSDVASKSGDSTPRRSRSTTTSSPAPAKFSPNAEDAEDSSEVPADTDTAKSQSKDSEVESCKSTISSISVDVLLGQLNIIDSTSGISRIEVHDTEYWLYYRDEVNLNNVIDDVIKTINSAGYPLEFNRFARTDNAIVFVPSVKSIIQ